jgi:hypothetical protein
MLRRFFCLIVNTVRSYFDKYVHGGEEELLEFNYVGRQPTLRVKQEAVPFAVS